MLFSFFSILSFSATVGAVATNKPTPTTLEHLTNAERLSRYNNHVARLKLQLEQDPLFLTEHCHPTRRAACILLIGFAVSLDVHRFVRLSFYNAQYVFSFEGQVASALPGSCNGNAVCASATLCVGYTVNHVLRVS